MNDFLTNEKKITNLKQFILTYSFLGGVIMWTMNGQIRDFLNTLVNGIIEPLFSMDLDENGKPDLAFVKKYKVTIKGATFPLGKILIEFVKTAVVVLCMFTFIYYLIKNTFLLERI